jgi:hypothetical protein
VFASSLRAEMCCALEMEGDGRLRDSVDLLRMLMIRGEM